MADVAGPIASAQLQKNAQDLQDLIQNANVLGSNMAQLVAHENALRADVDGQNCPFEAPFQRVTALEESHARWSNMSFAQFRSKVDHAIECLDGARILPGAEVTIARAQFDAAMQGTRMAYLGDRTFGEWYADVKARIAEVKGYLFVPGTSPIVSLRNRPTRDIVQSLHDRMPEWVDQIAPRLHDLPIFGEMSVRDLVHSIIGSQGFYKKLYESLGIGELKASLVIMSRELRPKAEQLMVIKRYVRENTQLYKTAFLQQLHQEPSQGGWSGLLPTGANKKYVQANNAYPYMVDWLERIRRAAVALANGVPALFATDVWPDVVRDLQLTTRATEYLGGADKTVPDALGVSYWVPYEDSGRLRSQLDTWMSVVRDRLSPNMLSGSLRPAELGVQAGNTLREMTDGERMAQLGLVPENPFGPDDIRSYVVGGVDYKRYRIARAVLTDGKEHNILCFMFGDYNFSIPTFEDSASGHLHQSDSITFINPTGRTMVLGMMRFGIHELTGEYYIWAIGAQPIAPNGQATIVLNTVKMDAFYVAGWS